MAFIKPQVLYNYQNTGDRFIPQVNWTDPTYLGDLSWKLDSGWLVDTYPRQVQGSTDIGPDIGPVVVPFSQFEFFPGSVCLLCNFVPCRFLSEFCARSCLDLDLLASTQCDLRGPFPDLPFDSSTRSFRILGLKLKGRLIPASCLILVDKWDESACPHNNAAPFRECIVFYQSVVRACGPICFRDSKLLCFCFFSHRRHTTEPSLVERPESDRWLFNSNISRR
jgi:hypothetical protein